MKDVKSAKLSTPETIQHITYNSGMCVTKTNRLSTQTQPGNEHHTPKTKK